MSTIRLKKVLIATISACAALLVSGLSLQVYWYKTEVPNGFERLSFLEISQAATINDVVSEQGIQAISQLDGKPVFLKGYIYPDAINEGLTAFILCRDKPQCAFGPTPKQSELIKVRIVRGPVASYSEGLVSVAGVFRLRDLAKIKSLEPMFELEQAEYLGPSKSFF